jgi:tRNA A37 threonylcarbamoyladenosine modification protein TsaB
MSMTSEPSAQAGVPPTVLAIDTTAGACSVALLSSGVGEGRAVQECRHMLDEHFSQLRAELQAEMQPTT